MSAAAYMPLGAAIRDTGALLALVAGAALAVDAILTVFRGRKSDIRLTLVACMCSLYAADLLHGPQGAEQSQTMSTLAVVMAVLGVLCWWDVWWFTAAGKRTSLIACVLGGFVGLTLASILAADSAGKGSLGTAFVDTFQWLMVVNAALTLWLGWRLINQGYWYLMCRTPMPQAGTPDESAVTESVIGN